MQIPRRGFLKILGVLSATPVLAPVAKLFPEKVDAVIGNYADYYNWTDVTFESAINPASIILQNYSRILKSVPEPR